MRVMDRSILLLLLFSSSNLFAADFQLRDTVKPVISSDYLLYLRKKSNADEFRQTDSSTNIRYGTLYTKQKGALAAIRKFAVKGDQLILQKAHRTFLNISGNYTATAELKSLNRTPSIQNEYVQGRSNNGVLIWRGAETNELFSFGPSIEQLEFDGSNYPYDINGKLVMKGSGKGIPAVAYPSGILRNGFLFSQAMSFSAALVRDNIQQSNLSFKASQAKERTLLINNKNNTQNFSVQLGFFIKSFNISAGYGYKNNLFTNSNRNGYLNRVYMNSLLTPASFNNGQGATLSTGLQRSYSAYADNPHYLLANENPFRLVKHNANLILERKGRFNFRISQSIERSQENSSENYAPGTTFFPSGISTTRIKTDKVYNLSTQGSYEIRYGYSRFTSFVTQRYIMSAANTAISYSNAGQYNYHRNTNELIILYSTNWRPWSSSIVADLDVGNKFYLSNTATKGSFLLPSLNARISDYDFLNIRRLNVRFATALESFNNEIQLSNSFSNVALLQLSTADALKYFPNRELNTYKGIHPIKNNEFNVRVEADYGYRFSLHARFFIRNIINDVFPGIANGIIQLTNLADHRNSGFELQIFKRPKYKAKVPFSSSLSFLTFNSRVIDVKSKDASMPIAGFSNVYKAAIIGQPLGVIVGSRFLRDAYGRTIIGADGFPLVDIIPGIIGDPTPDFSIKSSNLISWKNFHFSADIEWIKGGDIWNGTQAVMDYYGRSASSATLRNTSNYIFDGVLQDGSINTIPVSFYDVNKPINENRWVRYGFAGVAEEYIEKADQLRINNISVSYQRKLKKYLSQVTVTAYAGNIILWSAYSGADANQLLYDMSGTKGLDFFNLPSLASYGLNISLQF
jgi:hypothetical protein